MSYLIWDFLIKFGDLYRIIYAFFCYLHALYILYRAYFAFKVDFFICKTEFLRIPGIHLFAPIDRDLTSYKKLMYDSYDVIIYCTCDKRFKNKSMVKNSFNVYSGSIQNRITERKRPIPQEILLDSLASTFIYCQY